MDQYNDTKTCRIEMEKRLTDMTVRMQKLEDTSKNNTQELNKQSKLIEDIQKLSTSVSILANNMEAMLKEQQRQNERLYALESKPAKRWDSVIDRIIMLILGSIVGYVLVRLGLQ